MPDVRERLHVAAAADLVYALVSDLPRMGEWSPECTGVDWSGQVDRGAVGARFTGHNRVGWTRWSTTGTVVHADRGRRFAFEISVGPVRAALWTYLMTPDADGLGCVVTEEWTDRRPTAIRAVMDRTFGPRTEHNRKGMVATLANLKAAAEAHRG